MNWSPCCEMRSRPRCTRTSSEVRGQLCIAEVPRFLGSEAPVGLSSACCDTTGREFALAGPSERKCFDDELGTDCCRGRNGSAGSSDLVHMRPGVVVAGIAIVLGAACAGCTSMTAGRPVPTPAPVTVVSTVTVQPPLPTRRKVFNADAVERGVVQILKDEYKISDVGEATCPADQLVEPGVTFICIVEVGDVDRSVKITAKSSDGEYEVGQPH